MKENRIGIATDTTTSILPETALRLTQETGVNIALAPSYIKIGGEFVPDNSLTRDTFYQELTAGPLLETSHANPQDYINTFESLISSGAKDIISIHSNGKLTGGINSANTASTIIKDQHPAVNIHTIDTGSVSAGAGIFVLEALEMAAQGYPSSEIVNTLEAEIPNARILIAVTDAMYLIKSAKRRLGFRGLVMATGAALLNIHPIFSLEDKDLVQKARVHGEKKMHPELLAQTMKEAEGRLPLKRAIVVHTNSQQEAIALAALVNTQQEELGVKISESNIWEAGTVLAVYAGPGVRGLAVLFGPKK